MIPGVDDGASSIGESLSALRHMAEQGITHVITTPHFRASLLENSVQFESRMAEIDAGWRELRLAFADASKIGLSLQRGVELALDDANVMLRDDRLRLGETRFVLVEFPYFTIPPNSART